MINILYFGKIVDSQLHNYDEKNRKNPYQIAQYSYEKAFCDEISKKSRLDIISIYQKNNFPKDTLFFARKKREFKNTQISYLPYLNIPFVKELCYFTFTCIQILCWGVKKRKEKKKYIYANTHYPPVSLGIVLMGKLLKIERVITFTDLSLFTYSSKKVEQMPLYKRIIMGPYVKLVNKLQESYDRYVLFSEPMNEIVNPKKKPYIVMEGIYNPENIDLSEVEKKRVILHAGTLNREVGIGNILEVFEQINDSNLELWLIGKGDMNKQIEQATQKDKRIKFLGFMSKTEVFEHLKKATLLINLRDPNDEYTKYSFPSKTFEYMVSGTPFLTTKLEGIPNEYYKYLYTSDSVEINEVKKMIQEILAKDEKELKEFGKRARDFILNEKNANNQVDSVFRFLKERRGN